MKKFDIEDLHFIVNEIHEQYDEGYITRMEAHARLEKFCKDFVIHSKKAKKFEATWGEGYINQETLIVTMDHICEENGYTHEYIEMVEDLRVGQVANLSDPSGELNIKRIE
jgi:hypothetical protein